MCSLTAFANGFWTIETAWGEDKGSSCQPFYVHVKEKVTRPIPSPLIEPVLLKQTSMNAFFAAIKGTRVLRTGASTHTHGVTKNGKVTGDTRLG